MVSATLQTLRQTYAGKRWHWMPGEADAAAIIAGAVLVQHTSWANAERALAALRDATSLDFLRIERMPQADIASLVRVSGTPTVKARRLHAVASAIVAGGGLAAFLAQPPEALRPALLRIHGIGPETADAIALYAAGHRTFVVDAYTRRLFARLGATPASDSYDAWQRWFDAALPQATVDDYRAHHADLVFHGKAVCRAVPRCDACPLAPVCAQARAAAPAA